MQTQKTISPVDGSVYVERSYASSPAIADALNSANAAQIKWKQAPLAERASICLAAVDYLVERADNLGEELSWQMGRPIRYTPSEIRGGFAERTRHMVSIAEGSLRDLVPETVSGFERIIRREPLGTILTLAPWNYPYLTSVNSIVPAIMAGNVVILKHSRQTPLCAERLTEAFTNVGLPSGVFQHLHLTHDDTARLIGSPKVDFVAFTGSVEGGQAVVHAAKDKFIGLGLELGGKDPAYVRPDAALDSTVENLVDGAFFNSGQSCCGIERIYVHEAVYAQFVEAAVAATKEYVLGNPLDAETTLGPMVRSSAANLVRRQTFDAIAAGATPLVDESLFPASKPGTPYLAPQLLVDVDHTMEVMMEESFGPVVGVMKVSSDEEALHLMNDSRYGLTASVWTEDVEAARSLAEGIQTGTVFMNRCDYLDPALAWVGVKDSGRGCTLSTVGYEHLTRPKSFHFRLPS